MRLSRGSRSSSTVASQRCFFSLARCAFERQRWFRRGQRWRVGCEGRISVLKRRHRLRRCRYHGVDGMHRWVGFGVIADNVMNIATFARARATA